MSGPMIVTEPTPCYQNSEPYDLLIDYDGSRLTRLARNEALAMCGQCPVRVKCWAENADEGWVKVLLGDRAPTQIRPTCGTTAGARAHYKHREVTCEPCKAAENARARRRHAERNQAKCGTDGGYFRHKRTHKEDPCDLCREAHAAAEAARKAKKSAA